MINDKLITANTLNYRFARCQTVEISAPEQLNELQIIDPMTSYLTYDQQKTLIEHHHINTKNKTHDDINSLLDELIQDVKLEQKTASPAIKYANIYIDISETAPVIDSYMIATYLINTCLEVYESEDNTYLGILSDNHWDIAEAFAQLGSVPPIEFCELDKESATSEQRKEYIKACNNNLQAYIYRYQQIINDNLEMINDKGEQ